MSDPLVSVLIAVYNAGSFLRPSVESVLSQTYSNLEIIIIDDGSTDDCLTSISDLQDERIRVLRQVNAGKSVALNNALDVARGQFYAIHDADDISHPSRIARQVEWMLAEPSVAAVFTGYDLIINDQRIAPRFRGKDAQECRRDVERMAMPSHDPTVMFRMSMVKDIRYEPSLRVGQGWDHILRVGERYPMIVGADCLYSYRMRFDSNTRQNTARRQDKQREVLRRACQRRGLDPESVCGPAVAPSSRLGHRDAEHGLVSHFMESMLDLRRTGRWSEALHNALFCWRLHPLDPYYYKPLGYCIAPLSVIDHYRSRKAWSK